MGKLVDFGGAKSSYDNDSLWTAAREFCEETGAIFLLPQRGRQSSIKWDTEAPSFEEQLAQLAAMSESQIEKNPAVITATQALYCSMRNRNVDAQLLITRTGQWVYALYLAEIDWVDLKAINLAYDTTVRKKRQFLWIPAAEMLELTSPNYSIIHQLNLLSRVKNAYGLHSAVKSLIDKHQAL